MNKLIIRIPPCNAHIFLILHSKIRSRKKWEEKKTEKNHVLEYMCDQKYNNNKKEVRRNRERERVRQREDREEGKGYKQGLMCLTGPLLPPKISSAGGAGAWQQRGGPSLPRDSTPLSLVRETAGSSGIQTSAKRQEKGVHHCRAGKLHQINTAENKRQDNFQPARERSQKKK